MIKPGTARSHRSPPITRLIASDCFPFEFVSEIAEIESWRKEVYRPIYHVHKWWAKRLGSVFRAIVLGSALPDTVDLPAAFYQKHDFSQLTVFDPFMGSGTTLGEAYKLGCTALGRDINPVACESVRVAFGPLDRNRLMDAFSSLSAGVGERIRKLYETTDADGNACDTLYLFWVKIVPCPSCAASVDLFSSYVFARNAYPERKPEIRIYCPHCSGVFASNVSAIETQCPHCYVSFKPQEAQASGASATCGACQHKFAIAKAVKATGRPPSHRLFAKLVLTTSGEKQYLPISANDLINYEDCSRRLRGSDLPLPTLELEDGYNTRQAINYGYTSWRQFFNDRQLLALGWLRQAIAELPKDAERDAMRAVFSGALEFNNMFASYKGEGTGAIRHMFSHHILKPERVPIEGNVWGTSKSSGAFSTLFRSRLMRAIEYRAAPFEVGHSLKRSTATRKVYGCSAPIEGPVEISWPPGKDVRHAIHVSCGDSANSGLSEASVDLVVTDPPFFDNVHYSELADFFYAWQQLGTAPSTNGRGTTRHPREVQDVTAEHFAEKLGSVFSECRRVLRDQGLLIFTYQHSRADGWLALVEAIVSSEFSVLNCHPVKSDMAVATPKSQAKQPIQIDAILVCCKRSADTRPPQHTDNALAATIRIARAKARRMLLSGRSMSQADQRVLMFGQFLAEASRTNDLAGALRAKLRALEEAAAETAAEHDKEDISVAEAQLALLDEPGEYWLRGAGSGSA